MKAQVSVSGFLLGNVSVDLGSGGAGMAQKLLYHPEVGLSLQHVAGEGMPQRMRAHPAPESSQGGIAPHQLLNAPPGEPLSVPVQELLGRSKPGF